MNRAFPRLIAAAVLALASGPVRAVTTEKHLVSSGDPTLPKVAPGWKVELIAKPPKLHWPSVVEVAPDGRVFVAEHPMDMPGPSTKPIDRILCFHPDGRVTIFADHLYAVFGLRYLDGKLYVHDCPKFTVYTDDDGVGKNPKNIWDTDCIAPWGSGNLNDHIPSNLRLAMDGYFYVSTGDKGIYNCKSNIDGRTAEIHGGGIVRIRPDGTGLEVYCTGTRNHLDVAMNAEDEMFTYDNTDDGLGWWTRYTHMVDGGYYGYPHDYRPEESNTKDMEWYRRTKGAFPYRPWTLWRIDETGGGSAVGDVGYNEDALPQEYRGNTFHCEWGKGQIERFAVERDGGTYKIIKHQVLLGEGAEFRPLGISITADGTGFYIADWQQGGWGVKAEKGRLLKLTYTGEMHPTPKPTWYIPAAEGQKIDVTLPQLIDEGLRHPAESVRLVAQRRIAEQGTAAVELLTKLLNDTSAPNYARWHAIWTLDQIDAGKEGRGAILAIAKDEKTDLSVRMQAVRELGTRGAPEALNACVALLDHANAAMRFRAATALGRIGSPAAVGALLAHLTEKDFFAHYATFLALRRIGVAAPSAWPAIVKGFASSTPAIRTGTGLALHETFEKPLVDALAAFIADKSNPTEGRAAALAALAPLHRERPKWDGKWWGTQPQRTPAPAKTVEWAGTPIVLGTIESSLKDPQPAMRSAALDALQIAPAPGAVATLVGMFNSESDPAVRKAILHALASAKSPSAMSVVLSVLHDPKANADLVPDAIGVAEGVGSSDAVDALVTLAKSNASPEQLSAAFAALGRMRAGKSVPVLALQANNNNLEIAQAAAAALGQVGGKEAAQALLPAAADKRPEVRNAAVVALGNYNDKMVTAVLVRAEKDPVTRPAAIAALTRHVNVAATNAYIDGLGSTDAGLRSKCRRAIEQISAQALPTVEARLDEQPPLPKMAITELQRIYSRNIPIRSWQILGPFAADGPDAVKTESITGASANQLPAARIKGATGQPVQWKKVNATRQGFVDLAAQFDPHEHVYAYAVAEVNVPTDFEMPLTMGSDDGLILWVNGQQVFKDLNNHSWVADEFHATAHLKAGRNVFFAKITQDAGPWGFSVAYAGERKGKLFELNNKSADPKTYDAYATTHAGDPAKGSIIFHNTAGVGCIKCHTVSGQGGNVGPDLTGVAAKYNRAQIIESVLYPSKQIESGYEQTIIRTKDGNVQAGVVRGETDAEVTLYDSSANKIVIRKADIDVRKTSNVSVMPEGLQAGLSHQQFADLIAYLTSLKEPVKK